MRFHPSMCFKETPKTPKTVDGLILLIEKCMETLDEFKDENLENHYLIVSNYLMVHYKAWDLRRDAEVIPKMEQILEDLLSKQYAQFENLEKELKVGLITTHQLDNNLRKMWASEEVPCLCIKDYPHFEGKPDDYFIDACGNVYLATDLFATLFNSKFTFPCQIQPLGFIHPIMGILMPVPKTFWDQLNWNDPISKLCIINKENNEVRTYGGDGSGDGAAAAGADARACLADADADVDDDDDDGVEVVMVMVDIRNDVEVVMYRDINEDLYRLIGGDMENVGKAESWWKVREATVGEILYYQGP